MTKDTLTISGIMVTGIIGLASLMVHQSGAISELRSDMRADISELRAEGRARSEQIKELQQRVARIEGLLEGLRPNLASAASSD
ncbi:MAG: hypothetical protein OXP11_22610 [Gammaproteobacteria bacterium]|nr:hypothetical protein [Gammaproteobacteria bacterium]